MHQISRVVDVVGLSRGAHGGVFEVAGEGYESLDGELEVADFE